MYIPTVLINPPGPPVTGYNAWYDSSDVSSLTFASDLLEQWNDLGPNAYHLTQPTAGDRPSYGGAGARSINSITVPEFPGAEWMDSSLPRGDRTSSAFYVALTDTIAAGVRVILGPSGTLADSHRVSADDFQVTDHDSVWGQSLNLVSAGTAFAAGAVIFPMGLQLYVNSTAIEASNTEGVSARTSSVGRNSNLGGEYWDGLIAEIINYPFALSYTQALSVMAYLKTKWGTP